MEVAINPIIVLEPVIFVTRTPVHVTILLDLLFYYMDEPAMDVISRIHYIVLSAEAVCCLFCILLEQSSLSAPECESSLAKYVCLT
jgi:hypothetical protein